MICRNSRYDDQIVSFSFIGKKQDLTPLLVLDLQGVTIYAQNFYSPKLLSFSIHHKMDCRVVWGWRLDTSNYPIIGHYTSKYTAIGSMTTSFSCLPEIEFSMLLK